MQVFVCARVSASVCVCVRESERASERAVVSSPLRWAVWMAPVCTASHLSPLQDKGSSVSGPLPRLLEMIWSVLLSTEKIISSQRGGPSSPQAPWKPTGQTAEPFCRPRVAFRSDGQTQTHTKSHRTREK